MRQMRIEGSARRFRYLIPIVTVGLAFLVRFAFDPVLVRDYPFLCFFTAVVVSAWIGGLKPGLLAVGLTIPLSAYFVLGNGGSLFDPSSLIGLIVFVTEGVLVSALIHQLHTSRGKLVTAVRESNESRRLAEASSRAKKEFIANMSHEIRTPLTAILGFTELILKPDLPPAERTKYVSKVHGNVRALSLLIDDILEITAIERGGIEIDKQTFSLELFLRELKEELRPLAEQKGIELDFRTQGFLPLEIETDKKKLHRVLTHVVGNTIKASEGGAVSLTVGLRAKSHGKADESPEAFLAFVIRGMDCEVSTETDLEAKDAELEPGLPLAKRMARAIGGDVRTIKSRTGYGRTFLVTLQIPFAPGFEGSVREISLKSLPTPKVEPDSATEPLKGIKVLLVEDSPDNRFLISRFLDMAGAEVETARNGQEGVEKATHGDYNLVVMDIQMPVLDGNHAAQQLREMNFKKPLIALSAHALPKDQTTALDSGFNDYIVKPVSRRDLIEKVRRYTFPPLAPAFT